MKHRWAQGLLAATFVVGALSTACSDEASADGAGNVAFTSWGEEYIEDAIPASDVVDGWTITYDRFLVAIHGVTVADSSAGTPVATQSGSVLLDHKVKGDKPVVTFNALPAKGYAAVSYRVAPVTADTTLEGATEGDKARMVSNGYAIYVEAKATKEGVTKSFRWGFKERTRYADCKGEIAGKETDGVVVTNGGTDTVQLTIHGDHLFYDDLQSPDAQVRFGNIAAADANDDGEVTLDELAAVKLASIPKELGPYGTGSASGVNDLRAFVEALSRTVGHFRGEGECFAHAE